MHQIKIFQDSMRYWEVETILNKWLAEHKDIVVHQMKIHAIDTHGLRVIIHYEEKRRK